MNQPGHRIIESLAVSVVLFAMRVAPGEARGPDHAPPERTSLDSAVVAIPVDLTTGRPIVDVRLNGRGPFRFIFDTGASAAVIDPSVARELGLENVGTTRLGDPRDPEAIAADLVRVSSLRMGGLTLDGVIMATLEIHQLMGAGYAGVLGLFETGELLVTLDYPGRKLLLTRGELAAGDPGVVAYEAPDGIIALTLDVNGEPVKAHLDSGNPGNFMLPKALATKLPLKAPPVEIGRAATVTNSFAILEAELDGEIRVAGVSFQDPEVHFSELLDQWGNIGFDALRQLTVVVDARHHRLRMERTGSSAATTPSRRRIGIMLQGTKPGEPNIATTGAGLTVQGVVPGSLAEKAGLKAGDVIVSVNGRAVKELAPGELADLFGGQDTLRFDVQRAAETIVLHIE